MQVISFILMKILGSAVQIHILLLNQQKVLHFRELCVASQHNCPQRSETQAAITHICPQSSEMQAGICSQLSTLSSGSQKQT